LKSKANLQPDQGWENIRDLTFVSSSIMIKTSKMKRLQEAKSRIKIPFLVWLFIVLYLLFSMIPITVHLLFLSLAFLFWLIQSVKKGERLTFPGFFWPLIVYAFFTLVSSFFSFNLEISLKECRELLLFLIVPIVYTGIRQEKDLKMANFALLGSACINILYSVLYYFFRAAPEERIAGFMGHYMTQAGVLYLFCSLALSLFLFSREKTRFLWGAGYLLALGPMILTLTRSAWIGLAVATTLILLLHKPKSLVFIPLALVLFFLVSPQYIKKRAYDIFSLQDLSNIHRIEYLKAGIEIVKDYPLVGTGPGMVDQVFKNPKYGLSDLAKNNVHLHNNITQIAAGRGIPALIAWLVFIVWTLFSLLKLLKKKDISVYSLAVAGLAALLALGTAGLFEYNFSDSEITTLFLYIITIPFTLARIKNT
jgi:O-antigen ligase